MSTTFEVYPGYAGIPTYKEILDLATLRIQEYFEEQGIKRRVALVFDVKDRDDRSLGIASSAPFDFRGDGYCWFYWEGYRGGTDACFYHMDDFDEESCEGFPETQTPAGDAGQSLSIRHFWSFRRSAGQPALICMAYGFLAAAVAELTDGVLDSFDGAWDRARFPCRPAEFYAYWFKPEHALSTGTCDWHQSNLDAIRADSDE